MLEKYPTNIDIMRHGTYYDGEKGELPDDSKRLNEKGAQEVRQSAEKLAEIIGPDEEIAIWSSPMPRAIHTAEIIKETLTGKEKKFHKQDRFPDPKISVFEELTEIKNYSPNIFNPLVKGGELEFAGKRFYIDKNKTNPKNLSTLQYLIQEEASKIDPETKKQWPQEYIASIDAIENYADATQRIMKILSRLKTLGDKSYRIILVTHKGLTSFIVKNISGGESEGLNPAEFVDFEAQDGSLITNK
jgi:broad specificity phosphatase PhoE